MFDGDKFIECVRAHPAIWDMGCGAYTDKCLKYENWTTIGEMMYPKWSGMTEAERDELMRQMRNKWRHIRDNYAKFLNQNRTTKLGRKKRYVYADALSFLQKNLEKRKIAKLRLKEEQMSLPLMKQFFEEEPVKVKEGVSTRSSASANRQSTPVATVSPPPKSRKSQATEPIPTPSPAKKVKIQKIGNDDADRAFLLSLLPDYKKLSYRQKLDFRLHTLRFFCDLVQNGEINQCSSTEDTNQCFSFERQSIGAPSGGSVSSAALASNDEESSNESVHNDD